MLIRLKTHGTVVDVIGRVFDHGAVVDAWSMGRGAIELCSPEVRLVAQVIDPPTSAPKPRSPRGRHESCKL